MTRKYTDLIHLYKDSVYISIRNQMHSRHWRPLDSGTTTILDLNSVKFLAKYCITGSFVSLFVSDELDQHNIT